MKDICKVIRSSRCEHFSPKIIFGNEYCFEGDILENIVLYK